MSQLTDMLRSLGLDEDSLTMLQPDENTAREQHREREMSFITGIREVWDENTEDDIVVLALCDSYESFLLAMYEHGHVSRPIHTSFSDYFSGMRQTLTYLLDIGRFRRIQLEELGLREPTMHNKYDLDGKRPASMQTREDADPEPPAA